MVGSIITVAYSVPHLAVEGGQQKKQPKTYDACVLAASERNTKWSQYKLDVNKCRAISSPAKDQYNSIQISCSGMASKTYLHLSVNPL